MDELILYTSADGQIRLHLRTAGETVWLTQAEIAALFATTKANISLHSKNIFADGELTEGATVKESLTVQNEGGRTVQRRLTLYNLDLILAVGFRIRSPRGVEFRRWAQAHLQDYLLKGFAIDSTRLKKADQADYFDELLARIRDIRASEKRFYQKVRDLFALSSDYQASTKASNQFFSEVQNKLIYAVTGKTAAELVLARADPDQPNMALRTWDGSIVRKSDITIAKNYLDQGEIDKLNRLVVIFLDQAEMRASDRAELTLNFWRSNVDTLLAFSEQAVLGGPGSVSQAQMKAIVAQRYDRFDARRRKAEAAQADADDLKELEDLALKANTL